MDAEDIKRLQSSKQTKTYGYQNIENDCIIKRQLSINCGNNSPQAVKILIYVNKIQSLIFCNNSVSKHTSCLCYRACRLERFERSKI